MDLIKSLLPTLATALGGPLAGAAATFFAEKLGLSETTVDAVKAAVSGATPEQLVQMKQIDADLQKFFAQNGIDYEKIAAGDRDSARKREIATGDVITPRILAATVIGGFFWTVYAVLSGTVTTLKDPVAAATIGTLIGYVSAKADQVVSYYFGSSSGSAEKTRQMIAQSKDTVKK